MARGKNGQEIKKVKIFDGQLYWGGALDPYKFLMELKQVLVVEKLVCIMEHTLTKKFAAWSKLLEELYKHSQMHDVQIIK